MKSAIKTLLAYEFPNGLLQLFLLLRPFVKDRQDGPFLVGGCVRDIIMGRSPKDFDIATNADPEKFIPALRENGWKVDSVGEAFLVHVVSKNGEMYEIANFRKEANYDGRRPGTVSIGTRDEDADRRDFTMNAIYWNPLDGHIWDKHSATLDIMNKKIKFIGKPEDRIKEDYLRVFRLYRFASVLKFDIDKRSLKAAREHFTEAYKNTTPERVREELEKMK